MEVKAAGEGRVQGDDHRLGEIVFCLFSPPWSSGGGQGESSSASGMHLVRPVVRVDESQVQELKSLLRLHAITFIFPRLESEPAPVVQQPDEEAAGQGAQEQQSENGTLAEKFVFHDIFSCRWST